MAGCDNKETTSTTPTPVGVKSTPDALRLGTETAPGWQVVAESALSTNARIQLEHAHHAQRALATQLRHRLIGALEGKGDFANAVNVCKLDASKITAAVASEHDLKVGRTSFKLRNPANAPPAWMKPIVEARSEASHILTSSDGRLGVSTAIFIGGPCVKCHGGAKALAPGVGEALSARYPEDQATGFIEGDLRGWFWIEVGPRDH